MTPLSMLVCLKNPLRRSPYRCNAWNMTSTNTPTYSCRNDDSMFWKVLMIFFRSDWLGPPRLVQATSWDPIRACEPDSIADLWCFFRLFYCLSSDAGRRLSENQGREFRVRANFFDTISMISVILASSRSATMKTLRVPASVYTASGANRFMR